MDGGFGRPREVSCRRGMCSEREMRHIHLAYGLHFVALYAPAPSSVILHLLVPFLFLLLIYFTCNSGWESCWLVTIFFSTCTWV